MLKVSRAPGYRFFIFGIINSLFLVCTITLYADPSAQDIVAHADEIRAPSNSYMFDSTVTTYLGDAAQSENGYTLYVQNADNALVAFTAPSSEQGKSILLNGDDLWIFLPRLKRPARIALRQRLLGDVAIGDMARLHFARDYTAYVIGSETVDGKDTYILELRAKSENKTYNLIKYWVAKADYRPIKAEYYTVSGRLIKTGHYQNFRNEAGAVRPMTILFVDAVNPQQRSVLAMENMKLKDLPAKMFTKAYMKTLE